MAGCFGNHPEDRARKAELNRYLDKQSEGEEMDNLVEDMMREAVTDAPLFRTYDDDYEVIDRDLVMRCLANLDGAIFRFNKLHAWAMEHTVLLCDEETKVPVEFQRASIDAIFTALRIMQDKLKSAVEHEAEQVMESRNEMKAFGVKE